ncbi:hypothetical protein BGZ81_011851 [Podila clonocystis]|nr:hypothetical protein BGZ81_011851 [Podila clonocystis]
MFPTLKTAVESSTRPYYKLAHIFFNDRTIDPSQWHPLTFATYPSTLVWADYLRSLLAIKDAGTVLSAYARDCIAWYRDPANAAELAVAQKRLELKAENQASALAQARVSAQDGQGAFRVEERDLKIKKQRLNSGKPAKHRGVKSERTLEEGEVDEDREHGGLNAISDAQNEDREASPEGDRTPPPPSSEQGEVPLVAKAAARFQHVDASAQDHLSKENLELLGAATKWFKVMVSSKGIDEAIVSMRQKPFEVPWVHDLLYDRLKLLKKGIHSNWDENTYTSLWVTPDIIALYTGIDNLISFVYANENHYTPSAWRRSLIREQANSKGTNVDGCYAGRDGMIDLILENIGSPACSNHAKKLEDEKKCWRNAADALLERYYLSNGAFGIAKEYTVLAMVVYGYEVSLYATSILGPNVYQVKKIFHGHYHGNKDAYLSRVLVHLKLCLLLKTILERNQDVANRFDETIDSGVPRDEQASFNLKLHVTPQKATKIL